MLCPLILTYISFVFKLIIPVLYSTSSFKIVINKYRCSFSLYNIPNLSTNLGVIWFLITPLFIITLNYLLYYLTFKLKCLPIVFLKV